MKQYILKLSLAVVANASLFGCQEEKFAIDAPAVATPIELTANINTLGRASDAGFADGDRMGVFIMGYTNGAASEMALTGNHADNVLYTFSESENHWNGYTTIYWKDNTTPIDVVGYYPFDNDLASVTEYLFSVSERQDKETTSGGYEASDFLWAECRNVAPTTDAINLLYKHKMAGITVRLVEGEGFVADEWAETAKIVWIDNTTLDASVNLTYGEVTPISGNVKKITPLLSGEDYRAVVVPQIVATGKAIIGVNIDNVTYEHKLSADMTFHSGKMHTFTIEVNKRTESGDYEFAIIDEAVTAWIDDAEFHDGLLREYVVIEVSERGTLKQTIKDMGLDAAKISNLKVKGIVNWDDLRYMGQEMYITHLNLYDALIDDENDENDDIITGFETCKTLRKIVFPKVLRGISNLAFRRASITGDLIIPEGVTFIGEGAFVDCPIYGELSLPSTLKRIEVNAFGYTGKIYGELRLPDGLEYIGGGAFNSDSFEGTLVIPESVKYIGGNAFNNCNFTGSVVIPQGVKLDGGAIFRDCPLQHVEIPYGITFLPDQTFIFSRIQGEFIIPESVTEIGDECFLGTKITSVKLPDGLKILDRAVFANCSRLEGVIKIPKKVVVISEKMFENCTLLDGVHLHSDVVFISKGAFRNCYNMNTIICDALTPPVIEASAFDGVPKDNFTVEVPAAAISAYKMADGWKDFKRIAPYSNFVCRPAKVCALNNRHEEQLILNADDSWKVSHMPDWCELSQTSGAGKTQLRLSIKDLAYGSEARNDSIVFELNGGQFQTYCAVEQCSYEYVEDQLVTLQTHTKGNGVDIIFIGDGYDAFSLAEGKFIDLAREEMEHFFGLAPYDRLREYFNVYAAISLSQEAGINTVNSYYNTCFGTIFAGSDACGGSGPRLMPDDELIFPYVANILNKSENNLGRTLVILIPNTTDYDGGTYLYDDGRAISICPQSIRAYPEDTRGVVQREVGGFGFGKLANEKVLKYVFPKRALLDEVRGIQEWRGWYKNISTTGKLSDVPWSHYIFDPHYSDYVDVFEGAYGYSRYFYRSESQSCMSTSIPYYNTISRELITRRVLDYAGEWFDMEDFYNNDTNKWGSTGQSRSSEVVPSESSATFNVPIVVKGRYISNKPKFMKSQKNNER